MGATFPGHLTRAQPHEGSNERTSSRLHGCVGTTNRVPIHGRGTTLLSPSEVQNVSNRNVQWNEKSCRPPQCLQELDGATRVPGPRQMQSFRHHTKRLGFSLVQQTPPIVNLILQRAIHRFRLLLHRSSDIQEAELSLADCKAGPIGELEVLRPEV